MFHDLDEDFRPLHSPLFTDAAPSKLTSGGSEEELVALAKEVRSLKGMVQQRSLMGHYL